MDLVGKISTPSPLIVGTGQIVNRACASPTALESARVDQKTGLEH